MQEWTGRNAVDGNMPVTFSRIVAKWYRTRLGAEGSQVRVLPVRLFVCGHSSAVERELAKLDTRVRFPLAARCRAKLVQRTIL